MTNTVSNCCIRDVSPASSTFKVPAVVLPVAMTVLTWIERMRQRRALARLDVRLLQDIGMTRSVQTQECVKPFWQA